MIGLIDRFARLARVFDAETAHRLAILALKLSPQKTPEADDSSLAVSAFGFDFANPLGTAAGFDKNAEIADAVLRLGFSFAEIGTVTPRPQPGNPRPRLFRLDPDAAVINRLGFNSQGHAAVLTRLKRRAGRPGIVGVNIGANKDTADRGADYVAMTTAFAPLASYLCLNVSSPNTPGLRDLQQGLALDDLLARVMDARARAAGRGVTPVLLKIAPDLTLAQLDDVVSVARRRGVDGMIVGNTTLTRPGGLRDIRAMEQGGLSGLPLFSLSTRMLAETFVRVENQFPLIGAGGVDSGAAAFDKVRAGATLVQLYTGLVFRGFKLVAAIKADLVNFLRYNRHESLIDAVGRDAVDLTAQPWPR